MIEVVCAVIENECGCFLACQRPPGKHLAGMWEFPGGKVEPGETAHSALIREIREELCVEIAVGTALAPVPWQYERAPIRLLPFYCAIIGGRPLPIEHERLCWCAPRDFWKLSWAPADLPVLEQIRRKCTAQST